MPGGPAPLALLPTDNPAILEVDFGSPLNFCRQVKAENAARAGLIGPDGGESKTDRLTWDNHWNFLKSFLSLYK
jgi:hypothetical protein